MCSTMRIWIVLIVLIVALAAVSTPAPAQALYFRMNEGDQKCFIEEVPVDTLILLKWKATVENDSPTHRMQATMRKGMGFVITARDPNSNYVINKMGGPEGRIAFSSQVGGEHQVCVQSNTSRWFGNAARIKMEFDIDTGSHAYDYGEIAQAEDLNDIQLEIRRLNDQAFEIMKEQNYLKQREIQARDESESINARVMWWSIIETVILVASGIWQIKFLKNFFKAKKLV